uniref:Fetal and adult testis expressed 1 n=1 Tax=Sus scrofa TaxID=9823 RepID=A0A4X1SYK2_PIG
MAGGSTNTKKIEMSLAEELVPKSQEPSREQVLIAEMLEHGIRSLGASQSRQKLDSKISDSAAAWNLAANKSKKTGPQLPPKKASQEPNQEGGFQGMGFLYELPRNGLAHLPALVSWQLQVITGRLRALEDQGATWRHRETLFFTMLVSVCVANLWLWLRQ